MILLRRYSQRDSQLIMSFFQNKLYSLLPWGCHFFQHQGMICNSFGPMIIQHDQRSFWSFLQGWIFILEIQTRIFYQVLFLVLTLLPECIFPSGFLRLMGVLEILFCTNIDIDMVIWYIIFLQVWLRWFFKGIGYVQDKNNEAFFRCNFYYNSKVENARHRCI